MSIENNIVPPLNDVLLEDTGLFNYVGGKSFVYNKLKELGVNTVGDLFINITPNSFIWIKDQIYSNMSYNYGNRYRKEEIYGIISLIRYKYANESSEPLKDILETKVDMDIYLKLGPPYWRYMYPGKVFKSISTNTITSIRVKIDSLYKALKSCGFDLTAVKALVDIAYENKISNMSLGEFLCSLNEETIKETFDKKQSELIPFLNILNILIDFYQKHCKVDTSSHRR